MIATDTLLQSRYRIDGLIDRGGMADVYRARDIRLDRDVAVKVLREIEHERRFAAEARTLAKLQHPNLVRLLDAGTDNGDAFLVLELLDGATLRELLEAGPLPEARVARVAAETGAALDYIHRRDIVHRDVKPSNLMLDEYGAIRLADFGIARLLGATRITTTHQAIGTMAYIAPEQLEAGDVGPHTDVYSLGLVLIESLTGRRVFDGPPAEAAAARLSRDPDVPADLSEPWPSLLSAMTARDPALRPSAAAVRDRLSGDTTEAAPAVTVPLAAAGAAALHDADDAATAPVAPDRTEIASTNVRELPRRRRQRPWRTALLVAALLAGALVAGTLAYSASSDGGSPPVTTTTIAPTTIAPTTLPPQTAPPPLTARPDEGKDKGKGKGQGKDALSEFQKRLEELRKLLEKSNQGD